MSKKEKNVSHRGTEDAEKRKAEEKAIYMEIQDGQEERRIGGGGLVGRRIIF